MQNTITLSGLHAPNNLFLFGYSGLKILSENAVYWTGDRFALLTHHSFYLAKTASETANFSSIEFGTIATCHQNSRQQLRLMTIRVWQQCDSTESNTMGSALKNHSLQQTANSKRRTLMGKWLAVLKRAVHACVDFLIAQTIFATLIGLMAPSLEDSPFRQFCIGGMLVLSSALVAWKSDSQRQRLQQRVKAIDRRSPDTDVPETKAEH